LEAVAVQIAARQKASQAADSKYLIESCKVLYRTLVVLTSGWRIAEPPDHPILQAAIRQFSALLQGHAICRDTECSLAR